MPTVTSPLPSVDRLLRSPEAVVLAERFGRNATTAAIRATLAAHRSARTLPASLQTILDEAADHLARRFAARQRPVFNLTGTVLHTNLGRAPLPPEAAAAAAEALRLPTTLEFDLASGRRGERDDLVAPILCEITGAEAATVVNNNAGAVLLVLNTFACGKEVLLSRGELIEIGGSFRIPEIMARAGAMLHEVGTTNRTHAHDYRTAIGPQTALLMRVHTSNYAITGFTATVSTPELARIGHAFGLPLIEDLGSGSLVDLAAWGLPHEPTPQEILGAGADLVTFSGDKLLGGPQAGLILGGERLISAINGNPMKRALRLDKARLAALEHVLRLYLDPDPDALTRRLPALRLLTRPEADIRATAEHLVPGLQNAFPDRSVTVEPCHSQIGSGALPVDLLPSVAVTIGGQSAERVAAALRNLPRPVIGRLGGARLWLDCRCLEPADEATFLAQLPGRA